MVCLMKTVKERPFRFEVIACSEPILFYSNSKKRQKNTPKMYTGHHWGLFISVFAVSSRFVTN